MVIYFNLLIILIRSSFSSKRLRIANLERLKWLNEINYVKGLAQNK